MKKKHFNKWLPITAILLVVIALLGFGAYRILDMLGEAKQARFAPPTVLILSPKAGQAYPAGSTVYVSASASGQNEIQKMELRMDGELAGQVFNDAGREGILNGEFEITVTEGGHLVTVKAVDQNGLIGQSIPIPLYGEAGVTSQGMLAYTSMEGDTLESIAEQFGIDIADIRALNPDLGDGELQPGTTVYLPLPNEETPEEEQPAQPGTAAAASGPAGEGEIQTEVEIPNIAMLAKLKPAEIPSGAIRALMQAKPPAAPTGLQASYQDCKVTLAWNDNSEDEDAFRIWFGGLGQPARVIDTVSSSTHTGPVWYRFNTPPAGIYQFWVEAVNALGAQAGEETWIGIPGTLCEDFTAGYLYFSVEKFETFRDYDDVYCYVSVDGAPEQRFPDGEGLFISNATNPLPGSPAAGQTVIGAATFTIPYPEDDSVDLEGECLAWSGGSLLSLGNFSAALTAGEEEFVDVQFIETPNFKLAVEVRPYGWEQPRTATYTFSDPSVQAPFGLEETDTGRKGNPFWPTDRCLNWGWTGDESSITGFTVFLNGNPFKIAQPHERQVCYSPPYLCGSHLKFEVAANMPNGMTGRSQALEYDLGACPLRAEVQFVSLQTGRTRDTLRGKCDGIETYFDFDVWGATRVQRSLGGKGSKTFGWYYPMTCNTNYSFDTIFYALNRQHGLDRFEVQIDPDNPALFIGLFAMEHDGDSGDDPFIMFKTELTDLPVDNWAGYEKTIVDGNVFDSSVTYTIKVRALTGPEF